MTITEEFTVAWDDPKEAELTWMLDRVHAPEPITPFGSAMGAFVTHGFGVAFEHFSVPMRFRYKIVNGWLFATQIPLEIAPEEAERMGAEAQRRFFEALGALGELWDDDYLPEIKRRLGELATVDVAAVSDAELLAHWERVIDDVKRLWEIHFLIVLPAYLAVSEFDEFHRKVFGDGDPYGSYRLLQGLGNLTVDTGIALWELSRRAKELPEVVLVLTRAGDTADLFRRLEAVDGGPAFLAELRAYLDDYGQRGDKWDIGFPSWVEDPSPVLKNLREYLARDTHPAVELQQKASERERLIAEARAKLSDPEALGTFDFLLKAAEKGLVITEDHGFWIDFRGMYQVRRAAVEWGKRFARAGVIDHTEDVFYLELDEITETARLLPDTDRRALATDRRAARERNAKLMPPPFIGVPPAEDREENPVTRSMMKMMGGPPPERSGDDLRGHPGSAGVVTGRARVIMSITDADALEPGDILVAPTTAPPWTPLFAIAGGIVTDTGGILSHCAVVAREYMIPAVVGCGDATRRITDGQTVEIDGTAGVVRIL